jgi:hypothetical protein
MKKLLLFSILIYGSFAMAQTNPFRKWIDESPITLTLGFEEFEKLPNALTVYSPTTNMTNQYIATSNGYLRSNATNLPVSFNGITVDSFNPNGAINMQTALGMGLVRTLFKL